MYSLDISGIDSSVEDDTIGAGSIKVSSDPSGLALGVGTSSGFALVTVFALS